MTFHDPKIRCNLEEARKFAMTELDFKEGINNEDEEKSVQKAKEET